MNILYKTEHPVPELDKMLSIKGVSFDKRNYIFYIESTLLIRYCMGQDYV